MKEESGFFSRLVTQLLILLGVAAFVLIGRYVYYVEFESSPYSEVGEGINDVLPPIVKDWGCARLHERFPDKTARGCY